MALSSSAGKHFEARNFGDTSFFLSRFPVDSKDRVVSSIARRVVPMLADSALLLQGCTDEYTTTRARGGIPLRPASTQIGMEKAAPDSGEARARHFTLRALTNGDDLTVARLQIDRDRGAIGGFSLVATNGLTSSSPVYELRGAIDDSDAKSVFEIAIHKKDKEDDSLVVDRGVARDFVHAIREKEAAAPEEAFELEEELMRLVEASPDVTHSQAGNYRVPGTKVNLEIKRVSRIRKDIVNTTKLLISMQESAQSNMGETVRLFNFAYDVTQTPRYGAELSYLMRSPEGGLTHEEKMSQFEAISVHYRENPELLFGAMSTALDRLAQPYF